MNRTHEKLQDGAEMRVSARRLTLKRLLPVAWLAMCYWMPSEVWAACTSSGGVVPYSIPGYTATINPGVGLGERLDTRNLVLTYPGSATVSVTCSPSVGVVRYTMLGTVGAYSTYLTRVPGVGMRVSFTGGSPAGFWPVSIDRGSSTQGSFNKTTSITVELIKIGAITTSGTVTGQFATNYFQNGAYQAATISVSGIINIVPAVPTCKVQSPPPVQLGSFELKQFTGVNSVTQAQPLTLTLTCSGGAVGSKTRVYTTLTDQSAPGNRSDKLTLSKESTATGLGIQVLNGTTVIKYGADSSAAGNTNQWYAGETANGTFTIPLTARYIQTADRVTPGTAMGRATFTMSYQ